MTIYMDARSQYLGLEGVSSEFPSRLRERLKPFGHDKGVSNEEFYSFVYEELEVLSKLKANNPHVDEYGRTVESVSRMLQNFRYDNQGLHERMVHLGMWAYGDKYSHGNAYFIYDTDGRWKANRFAVDSTLRQYREECVRMFKAGELRDM